MTKNCNRKLFSMLFIKNLFRSKTRLSRTFHFKDIIPKEISLNLVHKFMCSSYNTTCYGDSERHFFVRASEYLAMTSLTETWVKNYK